MKNIILFDDDSWNTLLPLSYTRPVADLRVGILTIKEKWEYALQGKASFVTQDYLSEKFSAHVEKDNIIINGALLPNDRIVKLILDLESNNAILYNDLLIAARIDDRQFASLEDESALDELSGIDISDNSELVELIRRPYDIFSKCGSEIQNDINTLCKGRRSEEIDESNNIIAAHNVFLEPGVEMKYCTLNASKGPIYLGKNSEVMEGSIIRGPFALGEHSVVKIGAKIYGPTSIGPYSKVGGELSNVCIQAYSNKGHEGYLGNSVLGEWCNIGADSNSSNLKNNYTEVKVYDYTTESFSPSGLQFCGLIMGDHSKCGINTMFNTGSVVGVSANVFGAGYPRTFIPSFSWGGPAGYSTFKLEKQYQVAEKVMARRNQKLTDLDKKILGHVFHASAKYRSWE